LRKSLYKGHFRVLKLEKDSPFSFLLQVCKALLLHLVGIAREHHCGRMEWTCLSWSQPSIDFYLSLEDVQWAKSLISQILSNKHNDMPSFVPAVSQEVDVAADALW